MEKWMSRREEEFKGAHVKEKNRGDEDGFGEGKTSGPGERVMRKRKRRRRKDGGGWRGEREDCRHSAGEQRGSDGCPVESRSLCKWRCTKPLLTCIPQDKIFIYAIV